MIILRSSNELQRVTTPALQVFLRQRFRAIVSSRMGAKPNRVMNPAFSR